MSDEIERGPGVGATIETTEITDNAVTGAKLGTPIFAQATLRTSNPAFGAGPTAVSFDNEDADSDAIYALGTPTKMIVPAGLGGLWEFGAHLELQFGANAGQLRAMILKNAEDFTATRAAGMAANINGIGAGSYYLSMLRVERCVAGDFFTVSLVQGSGVNISLHADFDSYPTFWARRIGA